MTPRLVLYLVVALAILLALLLAKPLADQAVETDSAKVVSWGRTAPPYVVEESMFTTTTTARARTAPSKRTTMRAASASAPVVTGGLHDPGFVNGYPCGGADLPPCAVMMRESRGNPNAYNPRGCNGHGCYGLWQFSGAWACHFGLSCDIAHWTPDEQTYAARTLWDHGRGCSNWAAC